MKITVPDTVSVTATAQRINMPDWLRPLTLRNLGTGQVAFRYDASVPAATALTGNEAALRALGASVLMYGESIVIPPQFPWVDLACPTGQTATVVFEAGHLLNGVRFASVASVGAGTVAVGDTTTVALAANAKRIAATFVNDSNVVIYLSLGVDAVLRAGIRLNAAGGSFEINQDNLFTGAVNAICVPGTLGSANLCVTEF